MRGTPPGVQILSIMCNFWENLAKSYVGALWRVGAPNSRKSWIRHCVPLLSLLLQCLCRESFSLILFISAQVANDGYRAFNKAHTNMDKIRLQSMQTPDNLKSTLQVLFKVREQAIDAAHFKGLVSIRLGLPCLYHRSRF